jgi:type IV pilus assembly protein PilQ
VRGTVEISDFALTSPSRIVIDLVGARLVAPSILYDGVSRGAIRNVRYAQFRPDVVRVVVDLTEARDYQVRSDEHGVRVSVDGAAEFAAWSSDGTRRMASAEPAIPAGIMPPTAADRPVTRPAPAAPVAAAPVRPANFEAANMQESQQPRVSVTFDNATIQEVVATFAGFSGRSIVLGREVTGTVTAEIRDQPWDVAFNAILAGQGLGVTVLPGGILRVDSRANLATQDSLEPLRTRIVPINYARAAALQPSVAGIVSSRGRVVADTVNNAMIVTDLASRISAVDSFISALDQRTPQVAIQARIIFVDRTELEDLGLRYDLGTNTQFFNQLVQRPDPANPGSNFGSDVTTVDLGGNAIAAVGNASATLANGAPALKLIYSTVIGDFSLTAFLEALTAVTLADIEAVPAITVADNRNANIFSGERTPIRQIDVGSVAGGGGAAPRATTTFQQTGITLRVTPHVVTGTREVLMELHAERSAVVASPISEIGAVFTSQEATTQLLVRDGETAVIGGLTVTEITVTKSGIPFLVDLPVIGNLFGFSSNREVRRDLLILVTPHIVDDLTTAGTGATNR